MTSPTDVDLFDGIVTDTESDAATDVDDSTTESAESDGLSTDGSNSDDESDDTPDVPVETFATVPAGTVSVTEFAQKMTATLMRKAFESGEDLDNSQYVVPQAVYQTVKAAKNRIPHILVQGPEDAEARVYIKLAEATEWWLLRKDKLSTRGQGAARASSRTPEDNLKLLADAVAKALYAADRSKMWAARSVKADELVEKYNGFLKEQEVPSEDIALAIQQATDTYNTEKLAKEKEAEDKKKSAKAAKATEAPASDETAVAV